LHSHVFVVIDRIYRFVFVTTGTLLTSFSANKMKAANAM